MATFFYIVVSLFIFAGCWSAYWNIKKIPSRHLDYPKFAKQKITANYKTITSLRLEGNTREALDILETYACAYDTLLERVKVDKKFYKDLAGLILTASKKTEVAHCQDEIEAISLFLVQAKATNTRKILEMQFYVSEKKTETEKVLSEVEKDLLWEAKKGKGGGR
jgi:hypothetical protein